MSGCACRLALVVAALSAAVALAREDAAEEASSAGVTAEEVRHVVAESGVRLRARPAEEAEVLAVIPFGAEVRVITDAPTREAPSLENVPGRWQELAYQGRRGYAFSGSLLRYPPPAAPGLAAYARQLERGGFDAGWSTTEYDGSGGDHHPGTEVELVLRRTDMAGAFLLARRLFEIPDSLPYPGRGRTGEQTYRDPGKLETMWFRNLVAVRDESGELRELRYYVRGEGWGVTRFIRRRPDGTALVEYEFAD